MWCHEGFVSVNNYSAFIPWVLFDYDTMYANYVAGTFEDVGVEYGEGSTGFCCVDRLAHPRRLPG